MIAPPQIIAPRTIVPEENCLRIIAYWMIASGLLLPGNYPKDNCPQGKLPSG